MKGSPREVVLDAVSRLRSRWWRVRFAQHAVRCLFYILLASITVAWIPGLSLGVLASAVVALSLVSAFVLVMSEGTTTAGVAKTYDDLTGLEDRMSSSVELLAQDDKSPMVEALLEEAAAATASVRPAQAFPFSMPREGWYTPLPALLLAAIIFLPSMLNAEPEPDLAVEATLAARVLQLEELISKQRSKTPTRDRDKLVAELERLKEELTREKVDKKDAMAELAKMLDSMDDAEKKKLEELKKLLAELKKGARNSEMAQMIEQGQFVESLNKLQEEIEELEKKIKDAKKDGLSDEELKKLEELLKKAKEMRAKLMKLMQIDMDLGMMGEAMDFLEAFEGDLADLKPFKGELCEKCDKPGGL